MVPARLARKMSVLSVEPLALGGPGEIGAERAHRPGSRRLGGVEATGASVVGSHRGQLAGPPEGVGVAGVGPGAALGGYGGVSARDLGPDFLDSVDFQLGLALALSSSAEAFATTMA